MTLEQLKVEWVDNEARHKHIHELFKSLVDADPLLAAHRTYVESKVFGMGERSFWYAWKLVCESLPKNPKLCELGVFKAATLSLWKLLRPDAACYGVTPLDGRGTGWTEDDYSQHIANIHNDFELEQPIIIPLPSEDAVEETQRYAPFNVMYVDGNHSEAGALFDLTNYAPMVKSGGWLVVDDAACKFSMPWGYFQGIDTVCDALAKWEETNTDFEFQFNIVHLMFYKRK